MNPRTTPEASGPAKVETSPIFQRLQEGERFPYPLRFYAARVAWRCVWLLLFRPSPSRVFRWRVFLLRMFGAKVAATAKIRATVRVIHPWLLTVGEHSSIGDRVRSIILASSRSAVRQASRKTCTFAAARTITATPPCPSCDPQSRSAVASGSAPTRSSGLAFTSATMPLLVRERSL